MTARSVFRSFVRRAPLWGLVALAIAVLATFWLFIAADRYVSEARVVLQRSDLSQGQTVDFANLIAGGGGGNRADQLWLRDHLLSTEMLRQADAALKLRAHYSEGGDWWTRLSSADEPIELFKEYFHQRVAIELDEFAGVLSIEVQAYTPEMAQALAAFLLQQGEAAMNRMGHSLAQEQVRFLEQQVGAHSQRVQATRLAVLEFQNKKGLVSPLATTENLAAVVSRLEAQLSELQTRRRALLGYLQASAPNVVELDLQIAATENQMRQERGRLAAPGGRTLNATVEEFQRLQLEAEFAQEVYKTALVALERGRVEATRTLKKLTVLQAPSVPEYPMRPRRYYNTLVYSLLVLMLAGVAHLLLAIVRDHQD
ncbi:chain-length determining protein [Ramlibacter rhizophilus]|uniref:Chain-length determining protein n=1 Tax=Ramlibacter rhizophilus TaxID=1781167 RepID=A0A4Z0BKT0_9BURK|nr:chain-length determining protein [Ramlibacter rhizophilus]TFY99925.1 chain-length determining protein [Ramlibacter rhizophilus]